MAPTFVQAGSGLAFTGTGSTTVSMTGATAGNLIFIHLVSRGTADDWSGGTVVNLERIDGTDGDIDAVITGAGVGSPVGSKHAVFIGRAIANGTVSMDFTVGVSGEDLYARVYEFTGGSTATTVAGVVENGASTRDHDGATGTSVSLTFIPVVTNGNDRLALEFVALGNNQAVGDFTGESGGDLTEAVAEFSSATGATATLQLQTAAMPSPTTLSGGSITVTSVDWGVINTAIIPAPPAAGTYLFLQPTRSNLRW